MALPPLATVSALEEWLGLPADSLEGADAARAGAYLAAASTLVRSVTHRAWVTDNDGALDDIEPTITEDDVALVATIVVQAAERKWRNPSGAVQETKGPFSQSYAPTAALGIFLTDVEEAQLLGFHAKRPNPSVWSLRTTRSDGPDETVYVPVDPPGKPLPVLDW